VGVDPHALHLLYSRPGPPLAAPVPVSWESPGPGSVRSGSSQYSLSSFPGGYDGLPVEEMQGMGINSHPGSTYGPIQDMDMGQQHFEDMPPAPPQDNNQVAAWYDTDL